MSAVATSPRRAFVAHVMGMPLSVHVRGGGAASPAVDAAFAAVVDELRHVEATFSTFRLESEIRRLDAGSLPLAEASPEVHEVIGLVEAARRRTGGAFDARRRDADGRLRYDPAGLVKGWAAERALRHLASLPDIDVYLNAGGDIAVSCATALATPWRIGIEDPLRPDRILTVVELREGGIATSGTAHRGAHIDDPLRGGRALGLASVTVVGPSLMHADVLATAAFVRGDEALALVEAEDGYEALAVDRDGRATRTAGFRLAGEPLRVPALRRGAAATVASAPVRLGALAP